MEEKQISDKEVEIVSSENTLEKKQTVSSPFLPSYIKRCSRTNLESTIFDYTWTIEQYKRFSTIKHMIPSFPEIGQCEILMNVLRDNDSSWVKGIKLNILTNNSFHGSCETTIKRSSGEYIFSKFISGHISNMTLLIEFLNSRQNPIDLGYTLIINCKFEIFCNLINKTICMNLLSSSTKLSKDVTYFEDPSFDKFEYKDEELIKFIVGGKSLRKFLILRKSLCAINSTYFKNICLTHKEIEKNMTNELVTDKEVRSFYQILLYIATGSIKQEDYCTLQDLLTAADKYDVPTLKLTCEHYLLRHITIKNAVELIQLALLSNAKFLGTHSATFIKLHIEEIRNTEQFQNLPQENLIKIMDLIEKIQLPEGSTHHSLLPFKADKELTFANIGV
ncbi:speckle-type POZ protein homolog [Temnothorax longispinosus]|uniref:speckle-type POZ protein homolog n=1 Tax=Temnothorax longispinosus TaxID=300112 RepID=UPI003A9A18C2